MTKKRLVNQPVSRNENFSDKATTHIWYEEPSDDNPYIAKRSLCHGYDVCELMQSRSFIDVLYLLFRGELPSKGHARLLELLMIALINPGPRHPATRAAMQSAISKTQVSHILPIALSCLSGDHLGAAEVAKSMRFIENSLRKRPDQILDTLIEQNPKPTDSDWHIAPGFGSRFGSIDSTIKDFSDLLQRSDGAGEALEWGMSFSMTIERYNMGWLSTGIAAAVLLDLGFHPRSGPGLFQIISSPGILAHGLELANKPITTLPFIDNEHYIIEKP